MKIKFDSKKSFIVAEIGNEGSFLNAKKIKLAAKATEINLEDKRIQKLNKFQLYILELKKLQIK